VSGKSIFGGEDDGAVTVGFRQPDVALVREGYHRTFQPLTGYESLSPKERQVADLLCAYPPLRTKEIQRQLGITRSTMKSHIRSIAAKLGECGHFRDLTVRLMREKYGIHDTDCGGGKQCQ
jgi:DNA-binding CsgD family transcriptional regulator